MERSKYNRRSGGGAGAGRFRGDGRSVSGGGRDGSSGGRDGSSGGRGGFGERGGNHYQQYRQGREYQTGGGGGGGDGDGGRRGGRGRRDGTQMGSNPSPAQPWGYRPGQGGQGGLQMGTNPPPAQPWGSRPVQGSQGRTQRPQSAMGQGTGATGGRGAWSSGPPHVAGRGSSAPAVGGGAGAGEAARRFLYLSLFLCLSLLLKLTHHLCSAPLLQALSQSLLSYSHQFTMLLPLLPIRGEWRCSLLLQLHHLRLHWTISCTDFTQS